jgi:hypothetical protein
MIRTTAPARRPSAATVSTTASAMAVTMAMTIVWAIGAIGAAAALLPQPAWAQRDPTRPPGMAPALPAPSNPGDGLRREIDAVPPAPPALRQLLVVDGRRYVVAGSRLVGEGGRVGAWQVERIEDAAVVWRLRQHLHRVSLHPQVSKRPAVVRAAAAPLATAGLDAGAASAAPAAPAATAASAPSPASTAPADAPPPAAPAPTRAPGTAAASATPAAPSTPTPPATLAAAAAAAQPPQAPTP